MVAKGKGSICLCQCNFLVVLWSLAGIHGGLLALPAPGPSARAHEAKGGTSGFLLPPSGPGNAANPSPSDSVSTGGCSESQLHLQQAV